MKEDNYTHLGAMADILGERIAQDRQWGGADHDDEHRSDDWFAFIENQISKFKMDVSHGDYGTERERLVKIAALAMAGIQSLDRKSRQQTASAA